MKKRDKFYKKMSISPNECEFDNYSFHEVNNICSLLRDNPLEDIPISIYSYKLKVREVKELISRYPTLTWLEFLRYIPFQELWSDGLKIKGVLTLALCKWFSLNNFYSECVLEAAIINKNDACYKFCMDYQFKISYQALIYYLKDPFECDILLFIRSLNMNSNREICNCICMSSEEFIHDAILEHDNQSLFEKHIDEMERIRIRTYLIPRVREYIEKICQTIKHDPESTIKYQRQFVHYLNSVNPSGLRKLTCDEFCNFISLKGVNICEYSEENIDNYFTINFKPVGNEKDEPPNLEYYIRNNPMVKRLIIFLIPTSLKLLIMNKAQTELMISLINSKSINCLIHYLNIRKFLFPENMRLVLESTLTSNKDIMNIVIEYFITVLRKNIFNVLPVEPIISSAIKLNNNVILDSLIQIQYYPEIIDHAVMSNDPNIFSRIIKLFPDMALIPNFSSIKSLDMLLYLRSLGLFDKFSDTSRKRGIIYIYDDIPRNILLWIIDNFVVDIPKYSAKIIKKISILGLTNRYERKNYAKILTGYDIFVIFLTVGRDHEITQEYISTDYDDDYYVEKRIKLFVEYMTSKRDHTTKKIFIAFIEKLGNNHQIQSHLNESFVRSSLKELQYGIINNLEFHKYEKIPFDTEKISGHKRSLEESCGSNIDDH